MTLKLVARIDIDYCSACRFGQRTDAGRGQPTVGKYLADGLTAQRSEIGNPFLQFILQKSTASGQAPGLVLRAGADR